MFKRQAYITNSSSTSFVAYGIGLPYYAPPREDDADGDDRHWEDVYVEGGGKRWQDDPDVEFYSNSDAEAAVMYVRGSYRDIDWGHNPFDNMVKGEDWDAKIAEACKLIGITDANPGWFGWYNGNC